MIYWNKETHFLYELYFIFYNKDCDLGVVRFKKRKKKKRVIDGDQI